MTNTITHAFRRFFRNDRHWDDVSFFRGISIFHGLKARQVGRIMQAMQKRHYTAGEVLFSEGQVGKAVFIIESGQVELTRTGADGHVRRLGILGSGQVFGEMALLEQMQRTATATMAEDGLIYLMYTATLESLIRQYPDIGVTFMRNMAVMLSALLRRTNSELDKKGKES
jgi:CRP/FNR family transcriptional regulator, cyclic AMP receptor protein